ncbi:MAG: hypothetical protein FWG98_00105 [Candidatus Cloacimonetes bacterium]|nr:hypothetical protein [Candidatus Cloacimonadota bacterium]
MMRTNLIILIILLIITSCSVQSNYIQTWNTRQIKTVYVKPFSTELIGEDEVVNQLTEEAKRFIRSINKFQLVTAENTADAVFSGELIDKQDRYIIFNYWMISRTGLLIGENSGYINIAQTRKRFSNMKKLIK